MQNTPSTRKQFYFLTFTHTVLDSYATLLSHLLPLLLTKLVATAARNSFAGTLVSLYSVFSSLGQILFGWLSDRVRTVHFLTFGVLLTAVCLSLLGLAPSKLIVYLLLAVGGLGVAAFHPQATTYAGALAAEGRGLGTSIFLTGGNVGRALGPLALMAMPYRFGLASLAWGMVPGVIVALCVPWVFRDARHFNVSIDGDRDVGSPLPPLRRGIFLPLIVLFIIAAFRTVTAVGLESFLSIYLDNRDYPNQIRSFILALFIFAGSVGIMGGGWISDRVNTYVLLLFSLLGAPPLLYASLHTEGLPFLVFLFLGNVILASSITINIVLAQMMLRGRENIASSLMMGAAWGVGGLLNKLVGVLGDLFGLPIVLDGLVMLPLLMAPLLLILRDLPDLSKAPK